MLGFAVVCTLLVASAGAGAAASAKGNRPPHRNGTADVAYAGSLELLNEKTIGPRFAAATGYSYLGRGAGSTGLAREIASGEIAPNVFESIGSAPVRVIEPKFTGWYVAFAASPLVVAYDPASPYARALQAIAEGKKPLRELFSVMASPGFTLGRTNPDTDPQGQAFYEMVELAERSLHLPAGTVRRVLGAVDNPSEVFAETALDSRLEAGQLDAASAFLSQAVELHLPYVALPRSIDFGDPALAPGYARAAVTLTDGKTVHGTPLTVDITTVRDGHGVADAGAADAFVAYVLSARGRRAMRSGGYELLRPVVRGDTALLPPAVRRAVERS